MGGRAHPIRAAQPSDFDAVVALLAGAGLPTGDLTAAAVDNFLVATDASGVIGAVALERYENVGLLRSLVVAPAARGTGVGGALVRGVEHRARLERIGTLGLLTETAKDFFAHMQYAVTQRDRAPAAVKASTEFAVLCPVSAIYMQKSLH